MVAWIRGAGVFDISPPTPELVATYDVWGPFGFGLDGTTLFICDGMAGLKVSEAPDDFDLDRCCGRFRSYESMKPAGHAAMGVLRNLRYTNSRGGESDSQAQQ